MGHGLEFDGKLAGDSGLRAKVCMRSGGGGGGGKVAKRFWLKVQQQRAEDLGTCAS